jgi:hypothetical protein
MKVEEVQVENASGYRGKQLDVPSVVATIEFRELKLRYGTGEQWQNIVESFGVVYVTSITRDGCSGCIEQKPLFRELASRMVKDTPDIVRFSNIHIRYSEADSSESPEAKKALRHGAYPTYTICQVEVRSLGTIPCNLPYDGRIGETSKRGVQPSGILQGRRGSPSQILKRANRDILGYQSYFLESRRV